MKITECNMLTGMDIGSKIKALRKAQKLTQPQLAQLCGWLNDGGQSRISNYERGYREPSLADIQAIAEALKVPVAEIMGEADGPSHLIHHSSGAGTSDMAGRLAVLMADKAAEVKSSPDAVITSGDGVIAVIECKTPGITDRTYALRYEGPRLLPFGVVHTPCNLIVDPDNETPYGAIWLINDTIQIGHIEDYGTYKLLDFDDQARPKHRIDPEHDKPLGWLTNVLLDQSGKDKYLGGQHPLEL